MRTMLEDHFFLEATTEEDIDYIEGNGGVFGVAKGTACSCWWGLCTVCSTLLWGPLEGSPECFRNLMDLYDRGAVPPMATPGPDGPRVVQMGFRDGSLATWDCHSGIDAATGWCRSA